MWTPDQWRFCVGIIGNIITCGLFVSPMPTFFKIYKAKSVQEFQPWPYLATIFNCLMWVYYGTQVVTKANIWFAIINGFGILIETFYLFVFLRYSTTAKRRTILYVLAAGIIAFAAIFLGSYFGIDKVATRGVVIRVIACILNVVMYCSPLIIMNKVMTTKSVEFMPFLLLLAIFLNGCVWTGYAMFKIEPFIYVPNGLGLMAGLEQIILYAYYSLRPKLIVPFDLVDGLRN